MVLLLRAPTWQEIKQIAFLGNDLMWNHSECPSLLAVVCPQKIYKCPNLLFLPRDCCSCRDVMQMSQILEVGDSKIKDDDSVGGFDRKLPFQVLFSWIC